MIISKYRRYELSTVPFNTFILICITGLFLTKIASEASYNVRSEEFFSFYSLPVSGILNGSKYIQIFTAPFITFGYWEFFVYVFFIFLIAKNVEKFTGTIKLLRIFLESYLTFIAISYLFFKNSQIYGLWFYVFNIMWFYLQNQIDRRWFKYGYPIFGIIFTILILQGGKTEYWKIGHLAGIICVILDEKLLSLINSALIAYKRRKIKRTAYLTFEIEKQIDSILEKIYKFGYDSLTKKEKETLYKASKLYKDKLNRQL